MLPGRSAVQEMVRSVERHYSRIDILVNNAGEIHAGPPWNR
jgi:NADP-dependent 3-hydroxy acid dehydrogenase YdfG